MTSAPLSILKMDLHDDGDVVAARQRARQIAALLGFDTQTQTRVATAVSEIARNAHRYASGGSVAFAVADGPPALTITVTDRGPGFAHLDTVLGGTYVSRTGMGIGILGARRLMDDLQIETARGRGTTVRLTKLLPPGVLVDRATVARVQQDLEQVLPRTDLEKMRTQNEELSRALTQLTYRESELGRLNAELEETSRSVIELYAQLDEKALALEQTNRELEETNRGIIALYAELDQKASSLQKASEVKSRFLSHISHEFRTPLNSILSLSVLLMERRGDQWNKEQDKQVDFIRRSADELVEMVNDLLDTAKVEAGKVEVRPAEFQVAELFSSLRGMFKPLVRSDSAVELVIEEPLDLPPVVSDMGKVAQILRNFISNALKFTHQGEVRVTAALDGTERILFSVADTGIGIAQADLGRIFDDFTQVEGLHQARVKGTGLGLSLSRQLAKLLGGEVSVTSEPGVGSTFVALLPLTLGASPASGVHDIPAFGKTRLLELAASSDETARKKAPHKATVPLRVRQALIIDDNEVSRYLMAELLADDGFLVTDAVDGVQGLEAARARCPDVVILDLVMPELDGFQVLRELRSDPRFRRLPVVVNTSKTLSPEEAGQIRKAGAAFVSKSVASRPEALAALRKAMTEAGVLPGREA